MTRVSRFAGICVLSALTFSADGFAQTVVWGSTNDPALGVLRAQDIPGTTATPVTFTNIFGDGFNIGVTTSALGNHGLGGFFGPSWYFEGPVGENTFGTVRFEFFQTSSPSTPAAVTGVHFRMEDVDEGERFKEFIYTDAAGVEHTLPLNPASPLLSFSSGIPDYHATPQAIDVYGTNEPGSQPNKWIDVDFSALAIRSFSFRPSRLDSNRGSVELTALGEIRRYLDVGAGIAVAPGDDLRGFSKISTFANKTLAAILNGSAGIDPTVTMDFNTGGPGQIQAQNGGGTVYSDVLSLSGTAGTPFVLQLSYNPAGLTQAQESALFLAWFDGVSFVPAVAGNSNSPFSNFVGDRAYEPGDFILGTYGVDTYNNTVWAVIDHNSEFAAAPEPGSTLLAAFGGLALLARRRRSRPGA